jgi:hypothetical protein
MFLRGACEFSHFSRTELCQSIKTWEENNSPFFIFSRREKSQTNTGAAWPAIAAGLANRRFFQNFRAHCD